MLPKALLVLTLVYVVSPLDVIPDFIPVIGEMDDVVVVLSGLWLFIRLCPPEVRVWRTAASPTAATTT